MVIYGIRPVQIRPWLHSRLLNLFLNLTVLIRLCLSLTVMTSILRPNQNMMPLSLVLLTARPTPVNWLIDFRVIRRLLLPLYRNSTLLSHALGTAINFRRLRTAALWWFSTNVIARILVTAIGISQNSSTIFRYSALPALQYSRKTPSMDTPPRIYSIDVCINILSRTLLRMKMCLVSL